MEFSAIPAELLMPERPVIRGQTKYSPLVLQVGEAATLQVGSFSQRLWLRTLIVLLSASSVPVDRADFEKSATAHTHTLTHPYPPHNNPFQTPLPSCSLFPNSIPYANTGNTAQSTFINNIKSSVKKIG